jgi:hypothetical protein
MPHRDRWSPEHERDLGRRDHPDDYGQADYSADYGYDPRTRTGYRTYDEAEDRGDFGQADYSEDFAYDPRRRTGYRREYEDRREPRSWMDQARDGVSSFFAGRPAAPDRGAERRYGQARVIWAVIAGRFDHERGLDASDIEVIVDGSEVTLNGTVRDRDDKRRAEDLADVRGVTHVQNNLRIRRSGGW